MPRPVLPRLVAWVGAQAGFATVLAAWVGAQAGFATVLAAWVGAQAGFATVSGLGGCPGLELHSKKFGVVCTPNLVCQHRPNWHTI